ncbi:MAG: hypothetical protein AAGC67_19920 [Myxococcota bacterium]
MSSPLSLSFSPWQEAALVGLGLISLCYAVVFRVWSAEALSADAVFALAVAALVTAVAIPSVFDAAGARIVEWSPLPEALGEADTRAAELAALPGRLIDGALERLGFGPDEVEATPSGTPAPDGAERRETGPEAEPGWLSERIRPSVDGLVALLLRVATATTASLVLLLALVLRVTLGLVRRLRRVGERLAALEAAHTASTASPGPDAREIGAG